MLQIIFSSEDIARTRVAPGADPLWELVLSLHLLRGRPRDPVLAGWREEVTGKLRAGRVPQDLAFFSAINPARGYFPDFLTPAPSPAGLNAGLEALRSTPVSLLHRDLSLLDRRRPLPTPAAALARGEPAALSRLTEAMRGYQAMAVAPYWSRVESAVEADRTRRARALLDRGVEGLLDSLGPVVRWRPGVLEVPGYPRQRQLHLNGRGLLLVPSYFCTRVPVTLFDPEREPVLVYPVNRLGGLIAAQGGPRPAATTTGVSGDREALAALLGRPRASVLEVIGAGCSTGEVARRLGISPAAASQHATVLRNAGLLTSLRDRNTVVHTLTPLGRSVLAG